MKKFLIILFAVFCMVGCQKYDYHDEYYVKYVYQAQFLVNDSPQSMPDGYTFTYTDYDLKQYEITQITSTKKCELVCGPFHKDNKIMSSIQYETIEDYYKKLYPSDITYDGRYQWQIYLQQTYGYSSFDYMTNIDIYISKNNGPYVQRELVNGEYIIDF